MMKNLLALLLCTLFVSVTLAQTNNSKQMQKLETRIDFEYLTFSSSTKQNWIRPIINLQDFNRLLINTVDVSSPASLSVTENGKMTFKNGISQYKIDPAIGLIEDFSGVDAEFNYLSSNDTNASVFFRLNKQKTELSLSKDTVFTTQISKDIFASFRLVAVKKQLAVCSLDEIVQEVINRNNSKWIKKCYDAGSPELKAAE